MTPFRGMVLSCAALLGLGAIHPVHAGWQGVFEVTCLHCRRPAISAYTPVVVQFADPCPPPCPPPVVTRYVQRCFLQPVTTMRTTTFLEPVTTYRTSFYYEPVTTYRFSFYFDPCTCSYQQVARPCTSFRLRSQCCPVTSYVQRCASVPVTTHHRVCYWEQETCTPLTPSVPVAPAPTVTESPPAPAPTPRVDEFKSPDTSSPLYNRTYPPGSPGSGSSMPHKTDRFAPPAIPVEKPKPIIPKLDRIALDDDSAKDGRLVGHVVRDDQGNPQSGAEVVFEAKGKRETTTTDHTGKFNVSLASGNWSVYVKDGQGRPVLHSKIDVRANELLQMTLVSR